ncbi:hypothetical protein SAMN04489712_116100 [Thermomonospora echinospora]|uniref:EthD domain-containing protein n=1 Tax=Thermomonospora echinospora TaxID=1992 RepID=A0A1H6DFA9_9ACTN|nr:DUF4286 family protein [Thermomonospora echinospora]SEG83914.1 hypothetical protein SAMN04489712_116100 [Thermomonospora echinospora]
MPKGVMVIQTSPSDPSREDEFNEWYSNTHLPEVCEVPGIVAARRYRVLDDTDPARHSYLAIYELEADDLTATLKELRARTASGQIGLSDTLRLDPPPSIAIYELLE